jgi:hypothetical protein
MVWGGEGLGLSLGAAGALCVQVGATTFWGSEWSEWSEPCDAMGVMVNRLGIDFYLSLECDNTCPLKFLSCVSTCFTCRYTGHEAERDR